MACRQKCLSLAWCLQRAFNKCLLKPAESPGSSTPIPYFPQVESEQGVTNSQAWPNQDTWLHLPVRNEQVEYTSLQWEDLSFYLRDVWSRERKSPAFLQSWWEDEAESLHSPGLCGDRPEATSSDHILTPNLERKPIPCVRNHLLWLQHPFQSSWPRRGYALIILIVPAGTINFYSCSSYTVMWSGLEGQNSTPLGLQPPALKQTHSSELSMESLTLCFIRKTNAILQMLERPVWPWGPRVIVLWLGNSDYKIKLN